MLAKHWINLQRLKFGSFRGTVRFSGELCYLGAHSGNRSEAAQLEELEREVKRLEGVKRVYLDLKNWRKKDGGEWECLDKVAVQTLEEEASQQVFEIHHRNTE